MWNLFRSSSVATQAPNIKGDGWLNVSSLPQRLHDVVVDKKELTFSRDLEGVVVVIFFWDYTNPDSLQDVPYIRSLWERYESDKFLVIGVHTPQIQYASDQDKVQGAILRFDMDFPVVNDSSYDTWRRYGCKQWPRKLIVGSGGIIQYDHSGSGNMDELEDRLRRILQPASNASTLPPTDDALHTPPILFGSESALQQGIAASPQYEPAQYHMQFKLPIHHYGLSGWWIIQKNGIKSGPVSDDQAVVIHGMGKDVVIGAMSKDGCDVEVLINSRPIPERVRGRDIVDRGGRSFVHIKDERGYSLATRMDAKTHMVSLVPATGNVILQECLFS